ncbi:MAG: hypothetical protein U9Q62_04005 [Campylobacterota bacterium]|nr:hypothetical protein [Campylobacterota bacterium]
MGRPKEPGKLIWFFIMLIVRIALVFGVIALIATGLWGILYLIFIR